MSLKFIIILFFFLSVTTCTTLKEDTAKLSIHSEDESTYSTTWSSSQILLEEFFNPPHDLTGNSLRQIVHVSIGGELIRLKFSNLYGKDDLEIKSVHIADSLSQGTGETDLETDKTVTFGGERGITIPAGEETYCDTFTYTLSAQSEVAVSIYFGEVPKILTGHEASNTNSFIEIGNKVRDSKFSSRIKISHWYFLSAIEVSSKPSKKTIVCFGDSITDGNGSSLDKQHRYTDFLSFQLSTRTATRDIGVVNAGIAANLLTTSAIERFSRDVLQIKGAAYIIVLYGINDIILLNKDSDSLINAYKTLIKKAHKANKLIYGATMLPLKNHFLFSEEKEKTRNEVNEWIRNTPSEEGGFDKVFDFDKIVRDPVDPSMLDTYYDSGDGLHPNDDGYEMMVYAIDDIAVFLEEPDFDIYDLITPLTIENIPGVKIKLETNIPAESDIEVIIDGSCKGSKGFRVWTLNNEGGRTSGYYKTGPIGEGIFLLTTKLTIVGTSSYLLIKGPMSTINIDSITINEITVVAMGTKTVYDPSEAIPYEG